MASAHSILALSAAPLANPHLCVALSVLHSFQVCHTYGNSSAPKGVSYLSSLIDVKLLIWLTAYQDDGLFFSPYFASALRCRRNTRFHPLRPAAEDRGNGCPHHGCVSGTRPHQRGASLVKPLSMEASMDSSRPATTRVNDKFEKFGPVWRARTEKSTRQTKYYLSVR